ncbi:hypothetical protein ABWK57_29790 [Streptomyces sp. NPDC094045]|uniref:hypothetical protein n=1 Tax=Streptomyces sp. NPDC094045 TaxID=3161019 RepID=UPI003398C105
MSARGGDAPAASTAKHRRDCLPAVPRSPQVFTSWRQLKPGQVVFDRVKDMPCMVIQARGEFAVVVRPGGQPWEVPLRRLSPATEYHCRQLDALANHVAYQRRGEEHAR